MARLRVLGENPPPPRGNGENQLRELRDYITRLKDELEYLLTHLGEDNLDDQTLARIREIDNVSGEVDNINTAVDHINGEVENINTALAGKQDALTFDSVPTSGSDNPVKSGGVYSALSGKQNTLTFDNAPTSGSSNPVKSGGIYSALAEKDDADRFLVVDTGNLTLADQTWTSWSSGRVYGILMLQKPSGYHPISADINTFTGWVQGADLIPFIYESNGNTYLLCELDAATLGSSAKAGLRIVLEKD